MKIGKYELENDVDFKQTADGYEIFFDATKKYGITPEDFTDAEWLIGNGSILVIEE
jgi:hypothetical protein